MMMLRNNIGVHCLRHCVGWGKQLASANTSGGSPQPLVQGSTLLGCTNAQGFGMLMLHSSICVPALSIVLGVLGVPFPTKCCS